MMEPGGPGTVGGRTWDGWRTGWWQHLAVQGAAGRDVEPQAAAVQVEPDGVGAGQAELEPGAAHVPRHRQPGHQGPMGTVLRDLREDVPEAAAPVAPGCHRRGDVTDGDARPATPPPSPCPWGARPRGPCPQDRRLQARGRSPSPTSHYLDPWLRGGGVPQVPSPWSSCPHPPMGPHLSWLPPPESPPPGSPFPSDPLPWVSTIGSSFLTVVTSRVPNPLGSPPLGPHLQGPHSPVTPSPGSLHLGPHLPWLSPPGSPSQGHHSLVTLSPGSPSLGLHALGSPSLMVVTSRVPKPFGSPPRGSPFPSDPPTDLHAWVPISHGCHLQGPKSLKAPTLGSPSLVVATSRVPTSRVPFPRSPFPGDPVPWVPFLGSPRPWVLISYGCHFHGPKSLWVPTSRVPVPQ